MADELTIVPNLILLIRQCEVAPKYFESFAVFDLLPTRGDLQLASQLCQTIGS